MRVLLDIHALIWAVDDPVHLGRDASVALNEEANEVLISAATVWEIAIKAATWGRCADSDNSIGEMLSQLAHRPPIRHSQYGFTDG